MSALTFSVLAHLAHASYANVEKIVLFYFLTKGFRNSADKEMGVRPV
jgi:hypothetical protein